MSRTIQALRAGAVSLAVAASVLSPLTVTAAHAAAHVTNPFVGATQYASPDYAAEVNAQAAADQGTNPTLAAAEAKVANFPTGVWMDKIAAISGDSVHHGLQWHLDQALAQQQGSTPITVEVVIYDLPGRDCAALASNGELPATSAGLATYESQYIDPIATILSNSKYANERIVAIIEPDSLPNAVTNASKPTCAAATPYYEAGVEYALNKLHAIPNVYNYVDIAHSAWLGWSSNMPPAAQEFAKVAKATTAGVASVDGFISDTANYTPTTEPFLPNSTMSVGGQPLDSAKFYQWNPYFDEKTYDEAMYSQLVAQGFPSTIGILIDTSRNGWGGPNRPTSLNSSPTTPDAYVAANKIDQRSFRGDWCNQNGAGLGSAPTVQPYGAADPIIGFVWIKPPGESDGDYPTASHSHGDPHCDPSGTNSDGNGGTYPTGSIPGYDVPAGQWFGAQFQQLVTNAYPALISGGGGSGSVTVTSPGNQTSTVNTAVSLQITATDTAGGTLSYSATGLPTGLSISSTTGLISGTPTTAGTSTVTVTARDTSNATGSASFTWTVKPSGGGGGGGCSATYAIGSSWDTGFTANVTVTNTGSAAVQSWKVTWTWSGNQQITNAWNATESHSGQNETVSNAAYNGALAPGANTTFGFQASYSGTNTNPTLTCTAS
ncbi:glycoside hydrolase family 6 protein [Kutzneria kofuensis]|uniref:Glucanase n=1 Tax=Kutzneria kofuensis TaxID=103725 RepID=A0A7W9NLG7_9PSEU|nr:glycoside hydrolase family 6 protein [Kutzneria kofuensis]MBB5896451.1 cellulose 1,4-beta-cellobiosidase [Kutzneria kofuensis]